jgi:predicted RNase H-like HicB family nuclease
MSGKRLEEAMKKTYTIVYERDETGWWVATVKGVAGCHTQGRSIEQARTRIHEALELVVTDVRRVKLKEQINLPGKAKQVLAKRDAAQRRLAIDDARAQELTRRAVETLVKDLDLSVRDAGALLGLSHQRVQQLVHERAG